MSTVSAIAAFVNTALLTGAEAAPVAAKAREADFLSVILPAVQRSARKRFRHLPAHVREELEQDATAMAWGHFIKLIGKGLEPLNCVGTIVLRCIQSERRQEHFCGQETRNDALAYKARQIHGFALQTLACLANAIDDDGPIPDQVAFRIDFATWRASLDDADQVLIDSLAEGYRPKEAEKRNNLPRKSVDIRRRRWRSTWQQFQGEVD